MKYTISENDKWSEIEWFISQYPEQFYKLKEKWRAVDAVQIGALTVRDLCEIFEYGYPVTYCKDFTVRRFVEVVTSIEAQIEGFKNFLDRTTPPMTAQQRMCMQGLEEMTIEECILLTCKDFYNLKTLEDAQKLSVYEYIIARKSIYNEKRIAYNCDTLRPSRP